MKYVSEIDNEGNTVKEYSIDEFGNEEVSLNLLGEDADFNIFEAVTSRIKLELKINKELYNSGSISKELYEKTENILLDRIKPFAKYIEA